MIYCKRRVLVRCELSQQKKHWFWLLGLNIRVCRIGPNSCKVSAPWKQFCSFFQQCCLESSGMQCCSSWVSFDLGMLWILQKKLTDRQQLQSQLLNCSSFYCWNVDPSVHVPEAMMRLQVEINLPSPTSLGSHLILAYWPCTLQPASAQHRKPSWHLAMGGGSHIEKARNLTRW